MSVTLGGLGMRQTGLGCCRRDGVPLSVELASSWRPWIEECIEAFGTTSRCMFESNFPADRTGHDYVSGWNAFKRLVMNASPSEKADLFWRSACEFYGCGPWCSSTWPFWGRSFPR